MDRNDFRNRLPEHQVRFIEQFLGSTSARHQLLVSPTGAGKTTTAAVLAAQMWFRGTARRVLVLVPGALTAVWYDILRSFASVPTVMIRRRDFLEMQASASSDATLWPQAVVIMTQDTAKHSDVAASLRGIRWDLVVIDEAHMVSGQRLDLLKSLVHGGAAHRLLLLTATPSDELKRLFPDLAVITWDALPFVREVAQRTRIISYTRAPSEVAFLRSLQAFVEEATRCRISPLSCQLLLKAASSSVFTVEQTFLRILRGIQGGSTSAFGEDDIETGIDTGLEEGDAKPRSQENPWQRIPALVPKLEELLSMVQEVKADARLQAFLYLLHRLEPEEPRRRICAFTSFAHTASYIDAALRDKGEASHLLTGYLDAGKRDEAVRSFLSEGRVLIATTGCVQGFDLSCDAAIHYDLPFALPELHIRQSRIHAASHQQPCQVFLFTDESRVLPLEAEWLDRFSQMGHDTTPC